MSGIWLVSYIALWVLVILLTVVVLGLVRQLGLIHLRLGPESDLVTTDEGLELGVPGPDFRADDVLSGKEIALSHLKGHPTILLFVSPSCQPCQELMTHLVSFHRSRNGKVNTVLFIQAEAEESMQFAKNHHLKASVISDPQGNLSKVYQVRATPFAYGLDRKGIVQRRGVVNNLQGLEALLEEQPASELLIELPKPIEGAKDHSR